MKKFETVEELAKATNQLAGLTLELSKGHSLHTAAAAHHESHAAFHKAHHEAMDDGHEMKAHVGKAHEHHTFKAAHHRAMAEAHKALEATATKLTAAFGDDAPLKKVDGEGKEIAPNAGGAVNEVLNDMAVTMKTMATDMLQNDPDTKDTIRKYLAEMMKAALGDKTVPNPALAITPTNALDHLRLVPRAGSATPIEKAQVAPENEEMFAV